MRLNRFGDIAAGKGGGVVSAWLDAWPAPRVVIPYQSGAAAWMDDFQLVGMSCPPCVVKMWSPLYPDDPLVQIADSGVDDDALFGGGGVWAK
jgi:hypothetical protein